MNLYENKALSQKMDLKNKICNLNMDNNYSVSSFFTNISQLRDHLVSIGVALDEHDFRQTSIHGIPYTLETFLAAVNG